MTQKNLFRLLVALPLALSIASSVAGLYPGNLSDDWKIVLEWNGNEGIFEGLTENIPESTFARVALFIVSAVFLVIAVAIQIGMFLFWRFARIGYVLGTLIFIFVVPFNGLVVMVPLEAAMYELLLTLDGVVIAVAYLQPISGYFETKNA